jgi:hypothetical protein
MLGGVMQDAELFSLLLMGLLGTGHCIGMCGPIVLAIPAQTGTTSAQALYNLGRITTYSAVGAFLGATGAGLADLSEVARIQVGVSLLTSVLLLLLGLLRLGILQEPAWLAAGSPSKIPGFRKVLQAVTVRQSRPSIFLFGLMMGFLPCGLSYGAFAMALSSGGVREGAISLLAFGLGTLPGLFFVGTGASGLIRRYRRQSDLLAGILMIAIAVSLVVKALGALLGWE